VIKNGLAGKRPPKEKMIYFCPLSEGFFTNLSFYRIIEMRLLILTLLLLATAVTSAFAQQPVVDVCTLQTLQENAALDSSTELAINGNQSKSAQKTTDEKSRQSHCSAEGGMATGKDNKEKIVNGSAQTSEPERRALPAPLDPIFPFTEYIGPTIGVPDTDPTYPLNRVAWRAFPKLEKAKIKIYGWFNGGFTLSTSKDSNQPTSYNIVPYKPVLDQAVVRIERVPDTVQTKKIDWGFRFSTFYGIDYRWTTAQGYFSNQLLKHNLLYGVDPVEAYGLLYFPKVAKGMVLRFGRYISPPDIEAQLAPDNFLYTHSVLFNYDAYTNTGVQASIKLNEQWTIQAGLHAGKDTAPWAKGANASGQFLVRWVSKNNNDSIYGGVANINNGKYKGFFDNSQQFNVTWSHRFNKRGTILTMTEAYYLYQRDALQGGSVIFGRPKRFFTNVGPGKFLPGLSHTFAVVNYTAIKLSEKDFITLRPLDFNFDGRGQRSGYNTTFESWTIGWTHRFTPLFSIRPELRYERSLGNATPYDNGTKKQQFMFAMDAILRF
jgi:hypothetical protein